MDPKPNILGILKRIQHDADHRMRKTPSGNGSATGEGDMETEINHGDVKFSTGNRVSDAVVTEYGDRRLLSSLS